jgi:hypothetical protein
MNDIFVSAFVDELDKIADAGHVAELAGLGILAAPSIKNLVDPKASKKEKSHAKFETAGLATLAAPSAYKLLTKKAAPASPAHMKMMQQQMRSDAFKAQQPQAAQAAPALRGQPQTFDPSHFGPASHAPLELARPVRQMPKAVPAARPAAASPAVARAGGVMSRIAKTFRGA